MGAFSLPKAEEDIAKTTLARASMKLMQKDYDAVISMLERMREQRGEFRLGHTYLSLVFGDALAGVGRFNEALTLYEERLVECQKRSAKPMHQPPVFLLSRIRRVKKKLKHGKVSK